MLRSDCGGTFVSECVKTHTFTRKENPAMDTNFLTAWPCYRNLLMGKLFWIWIVFTRQAFWDHCQQNWSILTCFLEPNFTPILRKFSLPGPTQRYPFDAPIYLTLTKPDQCQDCFMFMFTRGGYLVERWVRGCVAQIRCFFGLSGFPMAPFLFENWFRYRSHFCKMHNFRWIFPFSLPIGCQKVLICIPIHMVKSTDWF